MRALIAVIIILIVGFFVIPMVAEGTMNTCTALEKSAVTNEASSMAGGNTSSPVYNTVNSAGNAANGSIASTLVQNSHPNTPTPISCTYYYWKSVF